MRGSVLIQIAVALAGLGMAAVGQADTIHVGDYGLADVTVDGFQLTGTVTLNASGIVDAANITLKDSALSNPVFTDVNSAGGASGYNPVAGYAYISDPGVGQLALYYLPLLDGSGDVDLCILSAKDCNSYQASYMQIYGQSTFGYKLVDLDSGSLDTAPIASSDARPPTPEPASLALLGTALIWFVWVNRPRSRGRRL
ncbi:MAG TPA: PEP-CTERM sorting domain-containing protein [Acidobacteriaceae bacterium]|nr:PEP-CTERM sorting domain-containing protein [Acidobacteriaceae bacterium]